MIREAFLDSAIEETLKPLVYGKRVLTIDSIFSVPVQRIYYLCLDVGCGMGDWCYTAAQSGSKSVDAFDL